MLVFCMFFVPRCSGPQDLRKPDSKHRIQMKGEKAMQAVVDFPKWILHDNSKHAQEHILTCDEDQNWKKYPMLEENELKIITFQEEGGPFTREQLSHFDS